MEKARKKGLDILRQVSKHTLPFIFRYFAIYVDILFWGCFEANSEPPDNGIGSLIVPHAPLRKDLKMTRTGGFLQFSAKKL